MTSATPQTTGSAPPFIDALAPWADSLELVALFTLDEHRVSAVNRAFARKFGQAAPAWEGRCFADLVHPDDIADWRHAGPRVSRPPFHISREHRWQTAQGWRWIAWEETAVRDADGHIHSVRAVGRDVTKRRLAEEHFRKLAQAVEQAPVSIVITTPGGTPQYVNSRYTEVTGYTLEEIFERQIPLLREGHPSEAAYRRFCAVVASGNKWAGELCSRRKDGGEIWELVQVSPIRDNFDQIAYLFCLREDITERKALEEQLRQAQKLESLGALAGGIAHDFNNIISIVRGFTELALALPPGDTGSKRYLESVHAAALRAAALVRQIRAFSLKTPVTLHAVRLDALVRELSGLLLETFPRDIEIRLDLSESLETFAADPDQIRQILLNLCVNARDAMPRGGVLSIATDRVPGRQVANLGADPALDYAHLRVADTGEGMTPEVRARVFEPFFSTKQDSGGTGLGLATVYGNVRNHHGLIDLHSEPGAGAAFDIYLPLRPCGETPLCPASGEPGSGIPPGHEHILLVEDETPILDLLGSVLRSAGYAVSTATDGAEAIREILRPGAAIDLLVIDLNMPRLGGIEVLKVVQDHWPALPVLVISGNLNAGALAELARLGRRHVLEKPFDLSDFGRSLRAVLDAARASAP